MKTQRERVGRSGLARACGPAWILTLALLWCPAAIGQSFHFTGEGLRAGRVNALSADGRVAAVDFGVWTLESGFHNFNLDPEFPRDSPALRVSGDGRTIVGGYTSSGPNEVSAYRWSGPGTFESLGRRPEYPYAIAYDADEHADVIIGRVDDGQFGTFGQGFKWTAAGGMELLGVADPRDYSSYATAVSRDGRTIVRWSSGTETTAVTWTSEGLRILQSLPGRPRPSDWAHGVSGNGRFIVGESGLSRMTLWTDGVPMDLGLAPGWGAGEGHAVTDDGPVVAGKFLAIFPGEAAAVWLSGIGVQTLATYLQSQGVEIPLGWVLKDCTAMSADGRTFGGVARHTSSRQEYGFVATIPSPSVVLVLSTGLLGVIHKRRRPVALGAISW